jgi:hypothetical protein
MHTARDAMRAAGNAFLDGDGTVFFVARGDEVYELTILPDSSPQPGAAIGSA